jgi:hypothetical protein
MYVDLPICFSVCSTVPLQFPAKSPPRPLIRPDGGVSGHFLITKQAFIFPVSTHAGTTHYPILHNQYFSNPHILLILIVAPSDKSFIADYRQCSSRAEQTGMRISFFFVF